MIDYKDCDGVDRGVARLSVRRRILIMAFSLVTFSMALFWLHLAPEASGPELPDIDIELGRPGVKFPVEDEWAPPEDWDPVNAVYYEFQSLEQQFASGANNLQPSEGYNSALPEPYEPYPDFRSTEYLRKHSGNYVPCMGPRGLRLNESPQDNVLAHTGFPAEFPEAPIGSSGEVGIDQSSCFDRFGRFGAYGLDGGSHGPSKTSSAVDWENVDWGSLQTNCVIDNINRFDGSPRPKPGEINYNKTESGYPSSKHLRRRSAILFRSYDGMRYTTDMLRTMRSIIVELSLQSGGEYEAFLLVHVKDNGLPIFDDPNVYEQVKQERVPKEFWNMTVLWNEGLWPKLYPLVPEGAVNVHISQWLPVQWFALRHPHFDHYWNWEMDIRYTGHHYELLEALDEWSRQQSRKGLWERNERFYVPRFHGNYSMFTDFVQQKYQKPGGWMMEDASIWGACPPIGQKRMDWDIEPPEDAPSPSDDDYSWGVGEDADLITMLPMFNPGPTHYVLSHGYYNYPLSLHPDGPPRRGTIITFYRLSNRLLNMMHIENSRTPGHHMSSECWPQSTALHHGLKAVYVPHSIFMDRRWPAKATNFIFNNGDTKRIIDGFEGVAPRGEGSGGWESVFGLQREHNFDISTWYYRTELATRLYKRFLGHEMDGIGGEAWEQAHGPYCLPPILLHQIKDIEDPVAKAEESQEEARARLAQAESEAQSKEQALAKEIDDARTEALAQAETAEGAGQEAQ